MRSTEVDGLTVDPGGLDDTVAPPGSETPLEQADEQVDSGASSDTELDDTANLVTGKATSSVQDSDELARFREAWKEEVRRKKQPSSTAPAPEPQSLPSETQPPARSPEVPPISPLAPPKPAHHVEPRPPVRAPVGKIELSPPLARAIEVYRRAVACEQQSNLNEALALYRAAFRIDANVDKAYHQVETQAQLQHAVQEQNAPVQKHEKTKSASNHTLPVEDLTRVMKAVHVNPSTVVTGTLAYLVSSWPHDLTFEPEDEKHPVHIRKLPDELLVHVLHHLDTSCVERFAAVNRKARVVSLDAVLWQNFSTRTYKPPQIAEDEDFAALLEKYSLDYRRLYIEHPRVRLDGVYIAVCHYIRAGLSENAWVNVSHLITYHRYLRFYPNGDVLSLLANDEVPPQQVISTLKPTLRAKGFLIGTWTLAGTTVRVASLLDPAGGTPRYAFQMTLELRSRPLGRWNRLDIREYESVEIGSGEAIPLALHHERPFWFSKVRSFV